MATRKVRIANMSGEIDDESIPERYEQFYRCIEGSVPAPNWDANGKQRAWAKARHRLIVRYWLECRFQRQRALLLDARNPQKPPWKSWDETLASFNSMLLMYGTACLIAQGTYGFLKTAVKALAGSGSSDARHLVDQWRNWEDFLEKLGSKRKLLEECHRSILEPGLEQWVVYQKVLLAMDAVYNWEDLTDYQIFVFVVTGRMMDLATIADDRRRFNEHSLKTCFEDHIIRRA